MAKKFENKKLNKGDHANIDKEAGAARGVTESLGLLALAGVIIKKVPWRKVADITKKVVFKV